MSLSLKEKACAIDRLPPDEVSPQLLDGGIDMRCCNVRTKRIERGELLLERGENALRVGTVGRGRTEVIQSEIPTLIFCRANPCDLLATAKAARLSR